MHNMKLNLVYRRILNLVYACTRIWNLVYAYTEFSIHVYEIKNTRALNLV